MASYDVQTYLLDRANIHDTVNKLVLYYDFKNMQGLEDEVFAPELHIDYSDITGGPARSVSRGDWLKELDAILANFPSTQHPVTCIVAQLPQPSGSHSRPATCRVLANGNGNLVNKDGSIIHNGGRYDLELTRSEELEARGQNPWRISRQIATKAWADSSLKLPEV